jgi:hypothetical protein
VEAYKWYSLAISSFPNSDSIGRNIAISNRARLTPLMTADQIAKAQQLTRDWKPTPPP